MLRMSRGWLLIFGLSISLASLQNLGGQVPPQGLGKRSDLQFPNTTFLARNCVTCHNERLNTANLNLQAFGDETSAAKGPSSGTNSGQARHRQNAASRTSDAAKEESASRDALGNIDAHCKVRHSAENPGRVMARRLNRVEYNNTIRDLLAVPEYSTGG